MVVEGNVLLLRCIYCGSRSDTCAPELLGQILTSTTDVFNFFQRAISADTGDVGSR